MVDQELYKSLHTSLSQLNSEINKWMRDIDSQKLDIYSQSPEFLKKLNQVLADVEDIQDAIDDHLS